MDWDSGKARPTTDLLSLVGLIMPASTSFNCFLWCLQLETMHDPSNTVTSLFLFQSLFWTLDMHIDFQQKSPLLGTSLDLLFLFIDWFLFIFIIIILLCSKWKAELRFYDKEQKFNHRIICWLFFFTICWGLTLKRPSRIT